MRGVWVVVLVAACASGRSNIEELAAPFDARDQFAAKLVDLAQRHDVDGLVAVLGDKVGYGGLWFADSECRRILPGSGTISKPNVRAFAECLATLDLAVSARTQSQPTIAMMTYGPGIEIEVALGGTSDKPLIHWIGFVGRRGHLTITPDTLESLRVEGTPDIPIEGLTWLQICLDARGVMTTRRAWLASSLDVHAKVTEVVATWKFRPFILDGVESAACSVVGFGTKKTAVLPFPPDSRVDTINVSPSALVRRVGSPFIVPDDMGKTAIALARVRRVVASIKLCVNEAGDVDDAMLLKSSRLRSYDQKLLREVKKWKYAPAIVDGKPQRVCTAVTFIYNQR